MNNPLYPIFCRLDNLRMLVVGAGEVGEEKLRFILKSSPNARVTIVAPWMGEGLKRLLAGHERQETGWRINGPESDYRSSKESNPSAASSGQWASGEVTYLPRVFKAEDVADFDLIIAATNLEAVNHTVYKAAKKYRRLVNVADTPDLCDFYLGSIVTRGALKVAISTNGQSPTFAKRFRQWLEASLPETVVPQLLTNLKVFRDELSMEFSQKVIALNELTNNLLSADNDPLDRTEGQPKE